jgi:prolycopene isomerase
VVVAALDARDTFAKLLGRDHVPARVLRRLQAMELSMSVLVLYLATDLDARALGAEHEMALYTTWHTERNYAEALAGGVPGISVRVPTLIDPSLAPPGQHVIILKAIAPRAADAMPPAEQDRFATRMLELAEDVLPGLRGRLTYVEGAGPGTAARFPLHRLGPIYGWAVGPQQAGVRRLPQRTPVAGLYLAGQWTQPGHGVSTVVQSGIQAARLVLGIAPRAGVFPLRLPAPTRAG